MEDTKNAVVTAKALITESLGMLNYGDITPDEHMKNLNKAKKVLTPKQIQTTLAQFSIGSSLYIFLVLVYCIYLTYSIPTMCYSI